MCNVPATQQGKKMLLLGFGPFWGHYVAFRHTAWKPTASSHHLPRQAWSRVVPRWSPTQHPTQPQAVYTSSIPPVYRQFSLHTRELQRAEGLRSFVSRPLKHSPTSDLFGFIPFFRAEASLLELQEPSPPCHQDVD